MSPAQVAAKLQHFNEWHRGQASAEGGEASEADGGQIMTAIDSTHTTAVDHAYHWQPMTSCPKGSKVQLLTRYGCAIYGTWTGKETIYDGWAPLPTRAPGEGK